MAETSAISTFCDALKSVRFRLLAIALLPTLVILPLLLGVTMVRWSGKFDALLITKVNSDLTVARQYLATILENTGERLEGITDSARLRDIVAAGDPAPFAEFLEENREKLGLDFLFVVDRDGNVSASAGTDARKTRVDWPVRTTALSGTASYAMDVFSEQDLAALSPSLAERARIELVSTPGAKEEGRRFETRGMMIHAASPLRLPGGQALALVGGRLLNQNLDFIDTINDLVYRDASLPEGSRGTATLFMDDVRISTNVRLFENRRALGTRVSEAVHSAVLGAGKVWLDSAFVVNDWYISAYEPLVDSYGKRVGMLYVGFLEAPFARAKYETLGSVIAAFLGITILSIPVFLRWARGIFKPLERMTQTISKVDDGDLGARTGLPPTGDEIGQVAVHLDGLLERLQQREGELRAWNEELNVRVEERTQELQLANLRIEATTKQLVMSEKLATIGEITAGVAHEINNPIAVIQGNLEVARAMLGETADVARTEFNLIDEQVDRISRIVGKLLQFARPEEFAGYVERQSPETVISDCMPLVKHVLTRAGIDVVRNDEASGLLAMNRTELQQVLVNLIVNAAHAMPQGGTVTLASHDEERHGSRGVAISVADTGVGMSEDVVERIFDPFFTTKQQEGTGLGLSVSQMLIARQGGEISVKSTLGLGTVFTIWLPQAL
ncbi:putative two-component histidine kinase [Agrobacterium rubi TR3 = NBRC 13261]|uniref:histidine kinase n=1 Tax=Agrobacterium rubi TR3 = NBRC 13261 TaxID=1368415 RepID=A0A081CX97_9HYPH|nr:cache domain-containing protein [Agrobacterium rubi]MBP1879772.1 signal transduction histidine kinase [Agrobacterium rubi]MCL6654414.1 two-component sensor histidine kinase [Agrobacterium rubi]GAK71293.1 putative two-component histidine kinase [Agrobacterium rubi TR3 = NBRC 13261]